MTKTAVVSLDCLTESGLSPGPQNYSLAPGSRLSFRANDCASTYNAAAKVKVVSGPAVAVDHSSIPQRALWAEVKGRTCDSTGAAGADTLSGCRVLANLATSTRRLVTFLLGLWHVTSVIVSMRQSFLQHSRQSLHSSTSRGPL